MTRYWRLFLGKGNAFAQECLDGGFIGVDFDIREDLTGSLHENWREFNDEFIPKWLELNPGKSKIAAGLACAMLWTVSRGYEDGDVILSPSSTTLFRVGIVDGPYEYVKNGVLPHRRPVRWSEQTLRREDFSDALNRSVRSIGTSAEITKHRAEIDVLLAGGTVDPIVSSDETIEDPSVFAMERHLEDFIVANWSSTPFGKTHKISEVDGEKVGQQYPTDTGPLDILAISNDGLELLVIELKKGRASDYVVGQVQRYMGYVKDELLEENQTVSGVIVALDDDQRIRRALSVAPGIDFYRYEVKFNLHKA